MHLDKCDIYTKLMRVNISMLHGYQANLLYCSPVLYFCLNSIVFISTVVFINEDNCCQSLGTEALIKGKLLRGIFRVDSLINVAANTQQH